MTDLTQSADAIRLDGSVPTVQDVAREAGVSVATVSRVLTGSRPVYPESERVVRAAAERVGYQPNPHARSLRTRRSQTMGMFVPDLANPFFGALTQAVGSELKENSMLLLIVASGDHLEMQPGQMNSLLQGGVDAMLMACAHGEVFDANTDVPLIEIDRFAHTRTSGFVGTDNSAGIRALVEHLRSTDRRSFAYVGSRETVTPARERLETFQQELPASSPVMLGDFSVDWGRKAVEALDAAGDIPDAIVCANDLIALGVIQRLQTLGYQVPREVAVTGFDDIVFAELASPALTTARQPVAQIAKEAVRLAMAAIRTGASGEVVRIAPELVVRGSSDAGKG